MFLIRFSFFQNKITKEVTNYISNEINSKIRIGKVSLNGFTNLQFNQIFVPDLNGDTILFVPKAVLDIEDINWLDRKFIIDEVVFKDAEIVLRKNPGKKKYEIEFLLNSFFHSKDRLIQCNYENFWTFPNEPVLMYMQAKLWV